MTQPRTSPPICATAWILWVRTHGCRAGWSAWRARARSGPSCPTVLFLWAERAV